MNKDIFHYADNKKIDPLKANRMLWFELDGEFNQILNDAENRDPNKSYQALDQLVPAVRTVFDLPEYDGESGYTEENCLQVLREFITFMSEKKKSIVNSQT